MSLVQWVAAGILVACIAVMLLAIRYLARAEDSRGSDE